MIVVSVAGTFRIEARRQGERFRVAVYELKGGRWQQVQGPFWRPSEEEADDCAAELAESLEQRGREG